MIGEFYRPLHLRAFRQRSGHLELRRDPVSGRGIWFAYGPAGSFLGCHSTRQQAAHMLETNMLRLLYRRPEFEYEEWAPWD
jgi:hypothetical protein